MKHSSVVGIRRDEPPSIGELINPLVPQALKSLEKLLESASAKTRFMAVVVALDRLRGSAGAHPLLHQAVQALEALLEAPDEKTRLNAVMLALDRAASIDVAAPQPMPQKLLAEPSKKSAADQQREARVKLFNVIAKAPASEVWTAPKAAAAAGIPAHIASALLLQFVREDTIRKTGPGMFQKYED